MKEKKEATNEKNDFSALGNDLFFDGLCFGICATGE